MAYEILEKMWNIMKGNEFHTDVAIKSEFLCTSCKSIMVKACNVPCGCLYCFDCLKHYLNDEEKFCIGQSDYCRSELINIDKNVFIDQAVNMKISRIVVKCPMESCEFIGELGKMADHMETCSSQPVTCPYYKIGCEKNQIGGDKIIQHFKEGNLGHARLLMNFVDNWKNEINFSRTSMLDLQEENKWIKEQIELKQAEEIILELKTKSKEQNDEIKKNKKRLDEIEINQRQARSSMESISEENTSLREELEIIKLDNMVKEEMISALQTKSEEKDEKIGKMKEKCEFLEIKQDEQRKEIEELLLKTKSVKGELEIVKQDMTKQETYLSFKMRLEEQEQTIKRNTEKTEDWKQKIDKKCLQMEKNQKQMETRHDKMTKENGTLPASIDKITKENDTLKARIDIMTEENGTLPARIDKLTEENGTMKASIDKITKENETLQARIDKLTEENGTMKASIDKITKENETLQARIDKMTEENGTLKTSIDKMIKANAVTITKSEKIDNSIKILKTKLIQIQANQNYEFLWCIQNWDEKKERARNGIETKIFSDPFYSHKKGYKMCLLLYPDGVGKGEKTHLALFVCVMQGEFDNILQWPFRYDVKLELLNQNTGLSHHTEIARSFKNPTAKNWQKPCSKRNIGRGFDFIELSELSSNASLCQGNQIYFRATPQIEP